MTDPVPEPTEPEPEEKKVQVEPSSIMVGWLIEHHRVGRTSAIIRGSVTAKDYGSITLSDGLVLRTDAVTYGGTWYRVDVQQPVPDDPGLYWTLTAKGEPAVVMRVRSGDVLAVLGPNGIYGIGQKPLPARVLSTLSYIGPALVPYESLVATPDPA